MGKLRIAFTGAHGVGKDQLAEYTRQLLIGAGVPSTDITVLSSAQQWVGDVCGIEGNEDTSDWRQLWGAVRRRFWEYETDDMPVVISPRCGVDEMMYQGVWLARQTQEMGEMVERVSGLVDTNGNAMLGPEMVHKKALRDRSEQVLGVLIAQAVEEVLGYWDIIYYKKPWSGAAIEEADHRSTNPLFQETVAAQFDHVLTQTTTGAVYRAHGKLDDLPDELGEAKTYLDGWVDRWMTALASEEEPAEA